MSTPEAQPEETVKENQPPAAETMQETSHTEVSHWVKPKMTASLSAGVQAVIRELAPGKVVNISQFIAWILDDYYRLQQENQVYNENQETLNTKLAQAHDYIADLKEEYTKSIQALKDAAKDAPAETAPATTAMSKRPPSVVGEKQRPEPAKEERKPARNGDFMHLLGMF